MQMVDQRLGGVLSMLAAGAAFSGQQRTPSRLDDPIDYPIGMGLAQRRYCRKGVQNVAHGAEADHQQAKVGARLQALIFSQGQVRRTRTKYGRSASR